MLHYNLCLFSVIVYDGFGWVVSSNDGKYFFEIAAKTYDEAVEDCRQKNGSSNHLAVVSNAEENDFLKLVAYTMVINNVVPQNFDFYIGKYNREIPSYMNSEKSWTSTEILERFACVSCVFVLVYIYSLLNN